MTEKLLQFIWQHRLYDNSKDLLTTDNEKLIIIYPGVPNRNAGPDFMEAKIRIGDTLWAGHVEIHIKSSDWLKHNHQNDANYSRLILHAVFEYDAPVTVHSNTRFSTLVLKPYIREELLKNYVRLTQSNGFIACEKFVGGISDLTRKLQVERMLAERLEEKIIPVMILLQRYQNSWQEVLYIQVARAFGLHVNQDAFEQLALQTPLNVLSKHKHSPLQIEAILFGQSGFLSDYFEEPYPLQLQKEYEHFKRLYALEGLEKTRWKFLRMRPAGFPTIRVALFAQLIHTQTQLFSKFSQAATIKEMKSLFDFKASPFWDTHYSFQEISSHRFKSPGESFVESVIINAIIPVLYTYGKMQGESKYSNRAIELFRELPPERNHIIGRWKDISFNVENAGDSQGLLQLKSKYCDSKRCLECAIGYACLRA